MDNRLDMETAAATVLGTIFMILVYSSLAMGTAVPDYVEVQICAIIVTAVAAIYGSVAGGLIPLVSYLAVHISYPRSGALTGMFFLIFFGIATGHYATRFKIRAGKFKGISLADYAVVEAVLAIIVWVCVQPLCSFYLNKADLRDTLNEGVIYCGLTIATELIICLPILMLANSLYAKRQKAMDTGNDYLYERE